MPLKIIILFIAEIDGFNLYGMSWSRHNSICGSSLSQSVIGNSGSIFASVAIAWFLKVWTHRRTQHPDLQKPRDCDTSNKRPTIPNNTLGQATSRNGIVPKPSHAI